MTGKYSKHYPKLLSLGIPIMIGQLGTIIMGIADTVMIGRYGTNELAAAGFVNNIIGMVLIAGIGLMLCGINSLAQMVLTAKAPSGGDKDIEIVDVTTDVNDKDNASGKTHESDLPEKQD